MNKKLRNIISLILNLTVIAMLIYVLYHYFIVRDELKGIQSLIFYTTDSNLFFGLGCLLMIPFNILTIVKKEDKIPQWVSLLKFYGTITVTITFLVVIFILAPLINTGFLSLYTGMQLYLHLLIPLIAIISFIFIDSYNKIETKHLVYNLLPTVIYTICYIVMVIGMKQMDVYQFLSLGIPIGVLFGIIIVSSSFFLGMLFRYLYKKRNS